jgi:hypothetical protein
MKVCFVRWSAVGFFYKFIFEALALEAVSVVVPGCQRMVVKSPSVDVSTVANRVSANVLPLGVRAGFWSTSLSTNH